MTQQQNTLRNTFMLNFKIKRMNNKELSKRVKELRSRRGLSQELLAENSGLSLRTVQRIENGETEPRGETLKRLSHALEVTPDELIDWIQIEDHSFIFNLNSAALSFILFPLLGILVPFVLWVNKKDKIKNVYQVGAEIINFQITWNILFFILVPVFMIARMTRMFDKIEQAGDISPSIISSSMAETFIVYGSLLLFLYGYNIFMIVVNMTKASKGKTVKYSPKIKFIR